MRDQYQKANSMDDETVTLVTGDYSRGEKLQGESSSVGGPGPLLDMYLEMAQVEDEKSVQNWNAVINGSLTFSGLFSAVVATFLGISVQDLKPEPQDKPAFYLDNIYQLLGGHNITHTTTFPTPSTFSPPISAILVNSLWFLSLVITLSCALLAILLQQWTCRYIKLTQPRSANSPHQRARIRAFFDKGVEDLRLQWIVDVLPILLHASLVLFLTGLLIYTMTISSNRTVFKVVVSWVGLCTVAYACFTLIPIFRHDSPYYTPLSSPVWLLCTSARYVVVLSLWCLTAFNCCDNEIWHRFRHSKDNYQRQLRHGIERVAEECARDSSSKIDGWVLLWTLRSSQDHELEQLFASILCNSSEFLADSERSIREKMADAVVGLMDRTLSSDLHPQTKQHRIMICTKAMAEPSLLINKRTLDRVLHGDWSGLLCSVDFGLMLTEAHYSNQFAKYYSQCVVSIIISRLREHDDRWFELATSHLDIPTDTLQAYLAHGDSMLLANCIFVCRRTMEDYSQYDWPCDIYARSETLELVSKFNIQETLPELQQEFCDMWNELVQNTGNQNLSIYILKHIRNVYCRLHQDTGAAPTEISSTTSDRASVLLFLQSYPFCTIAHLRPAKEPSPKDVPMQQNSASANPKTPSARQDGAYNPPTPGSADVVTLCPTHAASSSQASPRLSSGIVASPYSPDLRRPPSQPIHFSSSRPTLPIELLPLPATSSRAPLRLGCSTESAFGTSVACKDPWTPISTTMNEVYV